MTFSNAEWITNFGLPGSSGPLGIRADNNGAIVNPFPWLQANAVVATFSPGASFVSIDGIGVGGNGLRFDAYDSAVGGSLVAFDQVIGSGLGIGDFYALSVSAPAIFRLEIYQLTRFSPPLDGIVLDDLEFTPVPEPASLGLLAAGLGGLALRRRRPGVGN